MRMTSKEGLELWEKIEKMRTEKGDEFDPLQCEVKSRRQNLEENWFKNL